MKKISPGLFLLLTAVLLFFAISCTPESCLDETEAYVKAVFYKTSTGKVVAPDSLTIYGLGRDTSLIYNKAKKVTSARLPLDSNNSTCSFVITYNNITDTLTIIYTSYPHLISKECGYTYYHTIEAPVSTANGIKSVTVKKNTITTSNEENIQLSY
jgi:uncharacterized membrane protein YcgQ (UPF0703/DUF1980 family)